MKRIIHQGLYSSHLNFRLPCKFARRRGCTSCTLPRLALLRLAKNPIAVSIISSLLLSSTAWAWNPVQGFYGGFLAEVSHITGTNVISVPPFYPTPTPTPLPPSLFNSVGTVGYAPIGGGAGGVLGYKLSHYRLEAELLYNRVSLGPAVITGPPGILPPTYSCRINSINVETPICQPIGSALSTPVEMGRIGYTGNSSVVYGLINAYYDFFNPNNTENSIVPYVGIGIGQASITNNNDFVSTVVVLSSGTRNNFKTQAMQGIIGISYRMDDLTWASMDYRYLTTKTASLNDTIASLSGNNKAYTLNAITFSINFAFDKGAIDIDC